MAVKSLLLVLLLPAAVSAQAGGITHVDTIFAPSLGKNLIHDSNRRAITVYLPPSYSKRPYKRYPVVYLLHGSWGTDRSFIDGGVSNLNIRLAMDSLIHEGLVKEMIVVTPNANNPFGGSFYRNSVVTGNWEDFIYRDVVNFIDRKYRTIRSRMGRGIAGHSMGGYGALWVGMRHPEVFSAMYLLSPCCLSDFTAVSQWGVDPWKKAIRVTDLSDVLKAGFAADVVIGLSALYSPNPSKPPLFVDFRYRLEGDSLVEVSSIAEKWRALPMTFIPQYASNLKRMAIGFDSGRQDFIKDIPVSIMMLDSALTSLGITHSAELYDGDHLDRIRSRIESRALPFFSRVLH